MLEGVRKMVRASSKIKCPECGAIIYLGSKKLIIQVLKKNKELRWSELESKTGISKSSLSTNLSSLIDEGIVEYRQQKQVGHGPRATTLYYLKRETK